MADGERTYTARALDGRELEAIEQAVDDALRPELTGYDLFGVYDEGRLAFIAVGPHPEQHADKLANLLDDAHNLATHLGLTPRTAHE